MSMPVISALDFTGDKMVDETIYKESLMKAFYLNKTVLITGGTGFLGQLFIEKLLRCNVKEIYVLVRPKNNKSTAERIQETFTGELFVKLKLVDPHYMKKIKIIDGDMDKVDLGICDGDRQDIVANVEIVIHAAADVRFDKPLLELCLTNVRGTKALTALAEEMTNLIVFGYVSTAFSQYYRENIEEIFYPPPIDPDEMIRIAEYFDQHQTDEINCLNEKLLTPWENTYVFTKSLAEEVVRRTVKKFPTVVIRPSIVISTYDDPITAWTNNIYGLNGLCVGADYGVIRVLKCQPQRQNYAVCGDFVTNGTLAAMWDKANENVSTSNFDESKTIVHITSQDGVDNISFVDELTTLSFKYPSTKSLSVPCVTLTDSSITFFILSILYHVVPAIAYDAYFKLTNNELRLLPIYRKIQDFSNRNRYFVDKDWNFDCDNLRAVKQKMSVGDEAFFPCDVFKFNLLEYSYSYMLGLRTYVMKEPLNHSDEAEKKFLLLRIIYFVAMILYCGFIGCFIYLFLHITGFTYYLRMENLYDMQKLFYFETLYLKYSKSKIFCLDFIFN